MNMKNLMTYVNPSKSFGKEEKVTVKIQIDNSLDLGWRREDIILATNFPYEYNGIKAIEVSGENFAPFSPQASKISTIIDMNEKGLIEKETLYWFHDLDVFQNEVITEAELELGSADIGLCDKGRMSSWSTSSMFFASSAIDIFRLIWQVAYKYKINEEPAFNALTSNNIIWATEPRPEATMGDRFIPANIPGSENINERVKKMNISYNFAGWNIRLCYEMAIKPIKTVHFHPFDHETLYEYVYALDFFMYGKNKINTVLMPERLIKIFKKHGASKRHKVKGTPPKKMKNLMIYLSPEKKFLGETENLVKKQIDNSLKLGWKKKDIILITNFNYKYNGVKSTVLDDSVFRDIRGNAHKSNAIFHLLTEGVIKEAELWWFHDLDVFQLRKIKSPEIDLEDTTAGFMADGFGKFDTGSFFFKNNSNKIFEWMRNRAIRLNTDEAVAFMSLTEANYRNINYMYKRLPKKLAKIFNKIK